MVKLTATEQNAIAEIASVLKSIHWEIHGLQKDTINPAYVDQIANIVEKFQSVRWDDIYDRMHRTGTNA